MNPQQDRIFGGNLETLGLQATLKMLALGGKTGQLSVTATHDYGDGRNAVRERLDIYLQKGNIVMLHSSDPIQIDLLEILRLLRRINRVVAQEIAERTGNQLPYVLMALVERNVIPPAEYQQRTEFAIVQEIARALRWERGTFEFNTNVKALESPAMQTPLSVDHVLLEAIRMVDEWGKVANLTRYSTPRWLPDFAGDIKDLSLEREDIQVLFLANGQIPIYATANGLLIPEARVAASVEHLVSLKLIEVIDDQLERQLEQNLANVFAVSQEELRQDSRLSPEQRLQMLIAAMGTCINKLLSHHSIFARSLRGRQVTNGERLQYLEVAFAPILVHAQRAFPIIDTTSFRDGELDYTELLALHTLIRGEQLEAFYWEAAQGFQLVMTNLFQFIIADEIGATRSSRRSHDLWEVFAQEIAGEIERHRVRRIAMRH